MKNKKMKQKGVHKPITKLTLLIKIVALLFLSIAFLAFFLLTPLFFLTDAENLLDVWQWMKDNITSGILSYIASICAMVSSVILGIVTYKQTMRAYKNAKIAEERAIEIENQETLRKDKEYKFELRRLRLAVKPSLDFNLNYENVIFIKGKDTKVICEKILHFKTSCDFELINSYSSEAIIPEASNLTIFPITITNSGIGVARFSRIEIDCGGKRSSIASIRCFNVNEPINLAISFLPEAMNNVHIMLEAYYEDIYGCLYKSGLLFSDENGVFSIAPERTNLLILGKEIEEAQ